MNSKLLEAQRLGEQFNRLYRTSAYSGRLCVHSREKLDLIVMKILRRGLVHLLRPDIAFMVQDWQEIEAGFYGLKTTRGTWYPTPPNYKR